MREKKQQIIDEEINDCPELSCNNVYLTHFKQPQENSYTNKNALLILITVDYCFPCKVNIKALM